MIFIFILLNSINLFFAEKDQYFELKKFNSDYYFHNVISSDNSLFFGTSEGILTYDEEGNLILYDEDLVGSIEEINGNLTLGESRYDNYYNYLLPTNYQSSGSTVLFQDNSLFITNKGDLFQFRLKKVDFSTTPSIRSISKTYLGTYEGIYNRTNGKKITFPTYTNGYIREFEEITIILWDGLSTIENGVQKNYFSTGGEGILIGDQILGRGIDVVEIKHPRYLIFSNQGLYEINLDTEEAMLLKKSEGDPFKFIRTEQNVFGVERLFFHDKDHIYQYNFKTQTESILITSNDPIIDVYSEAASVFYILTNRQLLLRHLEVSRKNKLLADNISAHSLGKYDNILYLLSDRSLSIYHLNKSAYAPNLIKNEFNRLAHYINDDILELGTINGLYTLDKTQLEELFNSYSLIQPKRNNSNVLTIAISVLTILIVISTILWQRKIIEEKLQPIDNATFQEQVTDYIKTDLVNVDIASICRHFQISTVKLYERLGDIKPGHIIRKERLKMVRKMRRENKGEKEISRVTGFSVSYLKKI
jgi:hypothetical protein